MVLWRYARAGGIERIEIGLIDVRAQDVRTYAPPCLSQKGSYWSNQDTKQALTEDIVVQLAHGLLCNR